MKPKKSVLEKQETARIKNRSHWFSHKDQIIGKRSLQKGKITASQLLDSHGAGASDLRMDHMLDGLNINEREKEMKVQSNNDGDSADHFHLDECLDYVDELSADIEESDRSDNVEDDDESEESQQRAYDEAFDELETETLQEFLESMSSEAAYREHDQLINEDIVEKSFYSRICCRTSRWLS